MLSILIPTYNWDCSPFVADLQRQCCDASVTYEIIVADDCSTEDMSEMTARIEAMDGCRVVRPHRNLGRAAVRNFLANHARYKHLLFIDADSKTASNDFIRNWLPHLGGTVLGGVTYEAAQDANHTLAIRYGTDRERHKSGMKPSEGPFTTSNFVIESDVFAQIRFDESYHGYGHEDTLFGIELKRHGYDYLRTDNPVVHIGIDTNEQFLDKTRTSINRLVTIYRSRQYVEIEDESALIRLYLRLCRYGLRKWLARQWTRTHVRLEHNLLSPHPRLRNYALYKLFYFAYTNEQCSKE